MATQILALHWKAVRLALVPFIVAAFSLPLVSVQGLGPASPSASVDAYRAVQATEIWLPLFPLLAAALGSTLALSAWNWDHQQGHVYALSLPVTRWEYALLKLGAGAVLALVPIAAFLIGSLVAAASVSLPTGLHAYPMELTLRFMFATLLVYSIFFALAAGTIRTAVIVLTLVVATPLLGGLVLEFLANLNPELATFSPGSWFYSALVDGPGPFRVFTGSWRLIDV